MPRVWTLKKKKKKKERDKNAAFEKFFAVMSWVSGIGSVLVKIAFKF